MHTGVGHVGGADDGEGLPDGEDCRADHIALLAGNDRDLGDQTERSDNSNNQTILPTKQQQQQPQPQLQKPRAQNDDNNSNDLRIDRHTVAKRDSRSVLECWPVSERLMFLPHGSRIAESRTRK
jgi:hypothetical protein